MTTLLGTARQTGRQRWSCVGRVRAGSHVDSTVANWTWTWTRTTSRRRRVRHTGHRSAPSTIVGPMTCSACEHACREKDRTWFGQCPPGRRVGRRWFRVRRQAGSPGTSSLGSGRGAHPWAELPPVSWHIWIIDQPCPQLQQYAGARLVGAWAHPLDRVLAARGCLRWGRGRGNSP
jgi:hypothetical protein